MVEYMIRSFNNYGDPDGERIFASLETALEYLCDEVRCCNGCIQVEKFIDTKWVGTILEYEVE